MATPVTNESASMSPPGIRWREVSQVPSLRAVRPNPSVNRSTNGGPPAPGRWYAVHFHRPGAGVPPLAPGYLERWASEGSSCGTPAPQKSKDIKRFLVLRLSFNSQAVTFALMSFRILGIFHAA